jgi:hypothetical protein
MEKSPLAVPFHVAMLSRTIDRLAAKLDADPLDFRDRKWVIARERLARVTEAISFLIETPPPCDRQTITTLERAWVQLESLTRRRVVRASPGS